MHRVPVLLKAVVISLDWKYHVTSAPFITRVTCQYAWVKLHRSMDGILC